MGTAMLCLVWLVTTCLPCLYMKNTVTTRHRPRHAILRKPHHHTTVDTGAAKLAKNEDVFDPDMHEKMILAILIEAKKNKSIEDGQKEVNEEISEVTKISQINKNKSSDTEVLKSHISLVWPDKQGGEELQEPQELQVPQEPEEPEEPQEPQKLQVPQEPQDPQELQVPQVPQEPQDPQELQVPQGPEEPQEPQELQVPHMPQEPQKLQVPQVPEEPQVQQEPLVQKDTGDKKEQKEIVAAKGNHPECEIHNQCGHDEVCATDNTCKIIPCQSTQDCENKVSLPVSCIAPYCSKESYCDNDQQCKKAGEDFRCHPDTYHCKPAYGSCETNQECISTHKLFKEEAVCIQAMGGFGSVCICRSENVSRCHQNGEDYNTGQDEHFSFQVYML